MISGTPVVDQNFPVNSDGDRTYGHTPGRQSYVFDSDLVAGGTELGSEPFDVVFGFSYHAGLVGSLGWIDDHHTFHKRKLQLPFHVRDDRREDLRVFPAALRRNLGSSGGRRQNRQHRRNGSAR